MSQKQQGNTWRGAELTEYRGRSASCPGGSSVGSEGPWTQPQCARFEHHRSVPVQHGRAHLLCVLNFNKVPSLFELQGQMDRARLDAGRGDVQFCTRITGTSSKPPPREWYIADHNSRHPCEGTWSRWSSKGSSGSSPQAAQRDTDDAATKMGKAQGDTCCSREMQNKMDGETQSGVSGTVDRENRCTSWLRKLVRP
mmetsp:Transcript_4783/g.13936  ORF Transcript_4783/g.13936 Transcript_4783/m.13936 type:complete len:197 (+) Transcript_4783:53-643(+)